MSRIFFDVLEVNIAISVILLALCLLAEKLRKRYGASWLKFVWLLLAVRLLIPYNFSLPFTEIRLFDMPGFEQQESNFVNTPNVPGEMDNNYALNEGSQAEIVQNTDGAYEEYAPLKYRTQDMMISDTVADSSHVEIQTEAGHTIQADVSISVTGTSETVAEKNANFSYTEIMVGIWVLGIILGLFRIIMSYMHFNSSYKKSFDVVIDKELEQTIIDVQKKMIGKVLPVCQSKNVSSPMLVGILTPKLVLPVVSGQWDKAELEMIVAHEICHYKKKDLWLKFLMILACCLNWFNPLVYVMKKQFFYDMELACDEAVLLACNGEEREAYARMMLIFAGKPNKAAAFSTGFAGSKKRMKKRIDYMLDTGCKKKGIFSIGLTSVVIMTMTVFVSCGYKPYELEDDKSSEQFNISTGNENEDFTPAEVVENSVEQSGMQQPFDYNHEYNEMLRCYGETVYMAGADGIYRLIRGDEKELIYENSYKYLRGMEIYQNNLYFCGSVMRGDNEAATIYRMDLTTHEVEDALAAYSQVFDCLYNISVYEGNLYVVCGFESKRIGFELDPNGRITRQIDETAEDFLYAESNECMDLEWSMLGISFDSEEYRKLAEESKNLYYAVMDVAACKKLLQGSQIVRKYKDEMYSSLYIENADGTYEFLCDTRYSFPLLITDTGVYYCYKENNVEYIDYLTKISKPIYAIEGTDEVVPVNYDADYVYMLVEHNTGEGANGLWIEETQLVRVPREGGSAEILHRFEGNLLENRTLKKCAVYDNTMFFENYDSIKLDVKADTPDDEVSEENDKSYAPDDYGEIVNVREEFTNGNTKEITFYYEMENFYVNDTFENADKINDTLQKIYDECEQTYREDAEVSKSGEYVGEEPISTPYDYWHLLGLTLAREDYISIQYNNIDYMGGAHPYSHFDGITIDCRTGEEVLITELLGKSDEEILQQVSKEMGMDTVASWEDIDFYLTDSTIVFFYRMPNYWDDVVWEWKNNL